MVIRLSNLFSRFVLLLLSVVLFCNNGRSVWGLNYTKFRQVGDLRLARIQKHLDNLNKPPVFSIQVIKYLPLLCMVNDCNIFKINAINMNLAYK